MYGVETVVALSHEGVKFISIQEKIIAFEFNYAEIEFILLDVDDNLATFQLKNFSLGHQKCYLFECLEVEDIGLLVQSYHPHVCVWSQSSFGLSTKRVRPRV